MASIKVVVNYGGMVDSVYVTRGLRNVDVEIIDFCTEDEDELNDAMQAKRLLERATEKGRIVKAY